MLGQIFIIQTSKKPNTIVKNACLKLCCRFDMGIFPTTAIIA